MARLKQVNAEELSTAFASLHVSSNTPSSRPSGQDPYQKHQCDGHSPNPPERESKRDHSARPRSSPRSPLTAISNNAVRFASEEITRDLRYQVDSDGSPLSRAWKGPTASGERRSCFDEGSFSSDAEGPFSSDADDGVFENDEDSCSSLEGFIVDDDYVSYEESSEAEMEGNRRAPYRRTLQGHNPSPRNSRDGFLDALSRYRLAREKRAHAGQSDCAKPLETETRSSPGYKNHAFDTSSRGIIHPRQRLQDNPQEKAWTEPTTNTVSYLHDETVGGREFDKERMDHAEQEWPLVSSSPSSNEPATEPRIANPRHHTTAAGSMPARANDRNGKNTRQDFQRYKCHMAQSFLEELDRRLTDGQITSMTIANGGIQLVWTNRLRSTAGTAYAVLANKVGRDGREGPSAIIRLNPKLLTDKTRLLDTLAHEYCHLTTVLISGVLERRKAHGKVFKKWAAKAERVFKSRGIRVTTFHKYAVPYKYEWSCTKCSVRYRRRTRPTIDPKRQTCGACNSPLVQTKPPLAEGLVRSVPERRRNSRGKFVSESVPRHRRNSRGRSVFERVTPSPRRTHTHAPHLEKRGAASATAVIPLDSARAAKMDGSRDDDDDGERSPSGPEHGNASDEGDFWASNIDGEDDDDDDDEEKHEDEYHEDEYDDDEDEDDAEHEDGNEVVKLLGCNRHQGKES